MQIVDVHPTGDEEWHCPTCGRRFLLSWDPTYSKLILEKGDDYAVHTGATGGLNISLPQID
jgi:hypothetical protein